MQSLRHASFAALLFALLIGLAACAPAAESAAPAYAPYPPEAPAGSAFRSDSPDLLGATGRPQLVELYATF